MDVIKTNKAEKKERRKKFGMIKVTENKQLSGRK
jgi:hypothetical protein